MISEPVKLWPNRPPDGLAGAAEHDPTLTTYTSKTPAGTAIVICPGGGYQMLADHEGHDYALFLNALGITAHVLKYRLASQGYRHPAMLNDATRAVRKVRHLSPTSKIGIMGSSAGGHLASTLCTHFQAGEPESLDLIERESSRPDFGILCYPVISFKTFAHSGSREALLGPDSPQALVNQLSNETQVTAQTPPCFLWHTVEDTAVPAMNSILFAEALLKAEVACDLHLYQKGGHGIGLADKPPFLNVHPWANNLAFWLRQNGWAR